MVRINFVIERQSSHIRPRSQTRAPPRRAWSSASACRPGPLENGSLKPRLELHTLSSTHTWEARAYLSAITKEGVVLRLPLIGFSLPSIPFWERRCSLLVPLG